MKIIYDVDIELLYQQHLKACNHYDIPSTKWDKKAEKMAKNLLEKTSGYTEKFIDFLDIQSDQSLLDIGCGPGTLALPLARKCREVYALDYSLGMLEVLQRYQQMLAINNIHTIHNTWQGDWHTVLVIASRSTLVDNLDCAIDKLCQHARHKVCLTAITQLHFLDPEIFTAIGRQDLGFPTYIYWLNRLYQRGIQAELRFIESDVSIYQGKSFTDLLNSVEFSLGQLTTQEKQALNLFYQEREQQHQPIKHGQQRWAFISWNV